MDKRNTILGHYNKSCSPLPKERRYRLQSDASYLREKWLKNIELEGVGEDITSQVHSSFFNPYRKGFYYYQIHSLFLLGGNKWHCLPSITSRIREHLESIGLSSEWHSFVGKATRLGSRVSKDYVGRIKDNFVILQRLSSSHPYGYKLHQVGASIDIKRVDRLGFNEGEFFYRLSSYEDCTSAFPLRDFSDYTFRGNESIYLDKRFVGTVLYKDRTCTNFNIRR